MLAVHVLAVASTHNARGVITRSWFRTWGWTAVDGTREGCCELGPLPGVGVYST